MESETEEWNNNYIDKDIDQTDEIDNYINDIEMDNIVELNNVKTNNEYSTENFTTAYNELKKLELYDFNKLDNRISENINTSDTAH